MWSIFDYSINSYFSPTDAGILHESLSSTNNKGNSAMLDEEKEVEEEQKMTFKSMMKQISEIIFFAGPVLGIWLSGPIMSLIDTAVVGNSSSLELAALGRFIITELYLNYSFYNKYVLCLASCFSHFWFSHNFWLYYVCICLRAWIYLCLHMYLMYVLMCMCNKCHGSDNYDVFVRIYVKLCVSFHVRFIYLFRL